MKNQRDSDAELLSSVWAAIRNDSRQEAKTLLDEALARDPKNVGAWWLWANIAETTKDRIFFLRIVLQLAPEHAQAREQLAQLTRDPAPADSASDTTRLPVQLIGEVAEALTSMSGEGYTPDWSELPISMWEPAQSAMDHGHASDQSEQDPPAVAPPTEPPSVGSAISTPTVSLSSAHKAEARGRSSMDDNGNRQLLTSTGLVVETPRSVRPQSRHLVGDADAHQRMVLIAIVYLIALSAAELLTLFASPRAGTVLHTALMLILLLHTVRRLDKPDHRLWASLALVPLVRIVSLTLPLTNFALFYWFLFTSIPLFAAIFLIMRLLDMSWDYVGVNLRSLHVQLPITLLGFGLGYVEYLILRPEPLVKELTLQQIWWPALIILISTGFLEELLFRGVLQRTAVEMLGSVWGVIYGALFFGVLHVGYRSLFDVLFVTFVGLLFGWIVLKTRSIVGVTLAHGLTNITLFLIMPFIIDSLPNLRF